MTAASVQSNPLAPDLDHILVHTAPAWEALRGRRLFVTGGTGFFGRWLLESFAHINRALTLEAQMVVLSRKPGAFAATAPHLGPAAGISFVGGDVRTFRSEEVPGDFAFVIHAATAASAKLNEENPLEMIDTIVRGTRQTLEFAVAKQARRFLFTSSGAVYGPQPADLTHVPEDYAGAPDATLPSSAYGEGKRMAELLCACFQQKHQLDVLLARCFAFVGPFLPLDAHFAIGNFIRDALAGGPIRIGGDGTPFRSYLYAADLMIWLWTILFRGQPLRPYHVGSAQDLTIAQLAKIVRDSVDPKIEIVTAQKAESGRPAARYVPANARTLAELELQQWIDLPEAIRRTVRFHSPS